MDQNQQAQAVEIPAETVTVKISQLNQEQLEQVFNLLRRQQEQAVAESQALGRQIDDLKGKRAQLTRHVEKLGGDLQLVAQLMTPADRKDAIQRLGADVATVGELLASPGRQDASAPGAVLDASAAG